MAILVDQHSKVLVQGITGREGAFHAARMLAAGTTVVAGTSPGKGGQTLAGVPVFDSVADAVAATGATVSVIFVPARFAEDAMLEAADAGLSLVVCITEGIACARRRRGRCAARNGAAACFLVPTARASSRRASVNVGIMPADIFRAGPVGMVSRSGTLTYLIVSELSRAGLGQSTCVGIGGDAVHGLGFIECLQRLRGRPPDRSGGADRRDRWRRRGTCRRPSWLRT